MPRVRVGSKNQIVIPAEIRKELGIEPGDSLIVHLGRHSILVFPEPEDHVEALKGLGKEIWADVDTDGWLRRERESWEK